MNRFLRLFTNNVITLHPESQKFLEAARPERACGAYRTCGANLQKVQTDKRLNHGQRAPIYNKV